jgi:hypothetical protein
VQQAHRPPAVVHGDVGVHPGVDHPRSRTDDDGGEDDEGPGARGGEGAEPGDGEAGRQGEEAAGAERRHQRPVGGRGAQVAGRLGDEQDAEGRDRPVEGRPHRRPSHPEHAVGQAEGDEGREGEEVDRPTGDRSAAEEDRHPAILARRGTGSPLPASRR